MTVIISGQVLSLVPLISLLYSSTTPDLDESGPTLDIQSRLGERSIEVNLRETRQGDETQRSLLRDQENTSPIEVQRPIDAGSNDHFEHLQHSSHYCVTDAGDVDSSCQGMLNRIGNFSDTACYLGSATGQALYGGIDLTAPVCTDDPVSPPAAEQAVLEFPVQTDTAVIWEQIPGAVEEEFASLPIEGGEVAFEDELLGFGYINRQTNVFTDVQSQTFTRTLLGIQVEIRAIPVEYYFDYGDGTTLTTADPGRSAASTAQANDDAVLTDIDTPTSHAYQDTGVYPVQVTTTFIGEYRLPGGSWTPISNSASITASPGEADIWRINHRHVSGECRQTEDWGCSGPVELEPGDRPPAIFADQYDEAGTWRGP